MGHVLFVAAADHDHAIVAEAILDLHDLTGPIRIEHLDDVERLVEHDLHTRAEGPFVEIGGRHHAHLATGGEHVDRSVVIAREVDPERSGRLRELLDLFGQRLDLVALGAQGVGELLVLADGPVELLPRFGELLLEHA